MYTNVSIKFTFTK